MSKVVIALAGLLAAAAAAAPAAAQPVQPVGQAIAEDAALYAARFAVPQAEAERRLRAQADSVAVAERIAAALRHRLAGIAIEHQPQYRLRVLLTGTEPVAGQAALAAGSPVPVVFQLGAAATRDQLTAALAARQMQLRAELPGQRGIGLDQRRGELVLFVNPRDAARLGIAAIAERARTVAGVPVRVEVANPAKDMMLRGGGRLVASDPATGRRHRCTAGFAVGNGEVTGIVTAAHCRDALTYEAEDGREVPLSFVGGWGAGSQDVQLHLSAEVAEPLFYANRLDGSLRPLEAVRPRAAMRPGDFVCHWGEGTGYSCAEVELTDYAPPGELCGGPCTPTWVTVRSPTCKAGDSGGPVFSGTTGFGLLKGGSGIASRCAFYYFMPLDFLPAGWRPLLSPPAPAAAAPSLRPRASG